MKVTGEATLHAPAQRVWEALNDPEVLVRTIPGCQLLRESGPDEYLMTIKAGVASIKGTYQGTVRLTDQVPPTSFVLRASGAGGPGTVDAHVTVRLRDQDGATRLDYDADAAVGGTIAGVGQRVLGGVAKKTASEFFAAVDDALAGVPAPGPEPALAAGVAAAVPGPRPGEPGRVFTAPASLAAGPGPTAAPVLAGGLVALAGVLLGWLIGRASTRGSTRGSTRRSRT
jgi:carbon monoxide dehydrogenase subunit G